MADRQGRKEPFGSVEFPFAFLQAFGNKDTMIKRLRAGASKYLLHIGNLDWTKINP